MAHQFKQPNFDPPPSKCRPTIAETATAKHMPDRRIPTREDFRQAALKNPIVGHALAHVLHGTMTEDQAILWTLFALLDQQETLMTNLLEVQRNGLPPVIVNCPNPADHVKERKGAGE